jgi:hypothetical protein
MTTSSKEVIEQREVFSVFVLYEDVTARNRAIRICEHLRLQFEPGICFDLSWWKFLFLEERTLAAFASKKASEANLIIVSANPGKEFPWAVEHWMESWISKRTVWPSVLVPLIGSANDQADAVTPRHLYLTKVAQRAGMDFLPKKAADTSSEGSESIVEISRRAEARTPILENILNRYHSPEHWGINE